MLKLMNNNSILFIQGQSIHIVHTHGKAYQAKHAIKGPKT